MVHTQSVRSEGRGVIPAGSCTSHSEADCCGRDLAPCFRSRSRVLPRRKRVAALRNVYTLGMTFDLREAGAANVAVDERGGGRVPLEIAEADALLDAALAARSHWGRVFFCSHLMRAERSRRGHRSVPTGAAGGARRM